MTDPLEELKGLIERRQGDWALIGLLEDAIAAWERERTEAGETNEALAACQAQGGGALAEIDRLKGIIGNTVVRDSRNDNED